jgi:hypothetical protein
MNERDLLRAFTKLDLDKPTEVNGWLMCSCPFAEWRHPSGSDSTASFGVSIHDGSPSFYHCFTCKSKGDLGDLALALSKFRDDPELKTLATKLRTDEILGGSDDFGEWEEKFHVSETAENRNRTFPSYANFKRRHPSIVTHTGAIKYARRRRLPLYTCVSLGIRVDREQRRILFPVFDYWTGLYAGASGRICISETARKQREAELSERAGKRIAVPKVRDYGGLEKRNLVLSRIRRNRPSSRPRRGYIIVVEGLFAFARMVALGFGDCTVALLGSELTEGKADILKDIDCTIYWFVDNDQAGKACLFGQWDEEAEHYRHDGALSMLPMLPNFLPTWPEGKDDPDDLCKQEVEDMITTAQLYVRQSDHRKRRAA